MVNVIPNGALFSEHGLVFNPFTDGLFSGECEGLLLLSILERLEGVVHMFVDISYMNRYLARKRLVAVSFPMFILHASASAHTEWNSRVCAHQEAVVDVVPDIDGRWHIWSHVIQCC